MHPSGELRSLLEGTLDEVVAERVRSHLRGCGACRVRYREEQALMRAVAGDPHNPTPAEERAAIRQVLQRVGPPAQAPGPQHRPVLVLLAASGALVAAAAIVMVGSGREEPPAAAVLADGAGVTLDGHGPAAAGARLGDGALLTVDGEGAARLDLTRGATVTAAGGSRLRLGTAGRSLALTAGSVLCDVVPGRGPFSVDTPEGRVEVVGTRFRVTRGAGDATEVEVLEGTVLVTAHDAPGALRLVAGQRVLVRRGVTPVLSVEPEPLAPRAPELPLAATVPRAPPLPVASAAGRGDTVEALLSAGNRALVDGDYVLARKQAERAVALQPRSPEAELLLGLALRRQGDPCAARRHFVRFRALAPKHPSATTVDALLHEPAFAGCP